MSVLDQSKPYFKYFEEFSAIPRGSKHEQAMSDYLMAFAKELNLEAKQDERKNVVIYKPASAGKENAPITMLQAHMDMVWEKNNDTEFDFLTEGLKLEVKDGWLHAKGTTLGADDGCGVAYMMAVLADDTLVHPALECVFTVEEETGLDGAKNLHPEYLHAKYLVNLDHGGDNSTCVSNSGGLRVFASTKVVYEDATDKAYEVSVTGLLGGHSGGMITKNRGNANKLLARVLYNVNLSAPLHLVSIQGGLKENAIPREAVAVITVQKDISDILAKIQAEYDEEFKDTDKGVKIGLKEVTADKQMDAKSTNDVLNFMYLAPNGLQTLSTVIDGLPTVSLNMGVVRTENDKVTMAYSVRSPMESAKDDLRDRLIALGKLTNTTVEDGSRYPGWNYEANSVIREVLRKALKEVRGLDLVEEATHGGLETGIIKSYLPDLDIITVGPNMEDIHTPDERLDLDSFDKCYKVLTRVLELID